MNKGEKIQINRLLYLAVLFLSTIPLFKAQFTPYIQNFQSASGLINGQNWDISEGQAGNIYVANSNGLLSYNGLAWQLHQLPNKTTIRSVLALQDKIYTGSYQEFGYWKKNQFGILEYHSITGRAPKINFQNEEIWQILSYQNELVFRSFYAIYIYDGKKISVIVAPSSIISISEVFGELWVATLNHGIFKLKDRQLIPFISNSEIGGKKIIGAVEYFDNQALLGTELAGIWKWQNNKLTPFDLPANDAIKKFQLNKLIRNKKGQLFLGTIQNGIYYLNDDNRWININRKNGLENNTILAEYVGNNQLWLGMDSGIANIELSSANLFYNDLSGNLGATYDICSYQNKDYVGSNTGLYTLNDSGDLNFIPNTQGQVWDLTVIEDDLLCGHNNGTFSIKENSAKLISPYSGGYVIKKIPNAQHQYIQATYAGLVKFEKIGNQWEVKHLGEPYIPIRYLEFEDANTAWGVHANKGLYRIIFEPGCEKIKKAEPVTNKLWSDYDLRIYKFKQDLILKSGSSWFIFDPIKNEWNQSDYLNKNFGNDTKIISKDNEEYIVLKSADNIDFRPAANFSESKYITPVFNTNREVLHEEISGPFNDSLWFFNLKEGFRLFNTGKFKNSKDSIYPPVINQISYDNKNLALSRNSTYQIPFSHSNLKIWLSSPKNKNYKLEYTFDKDSLNWQQIPSDVLEFNHLYSGENKILVRTVNEINQKSSHINIIVDVSPPWYLSKTAYLIYFIILIFSLYYFYQLHERKLKKEQELLKEKLKQEQEEKLREQETENEKKIIALRNQNLKKEVKSKSKELANHSMALIRKNESLQEIKNILNNNKKLVNDPIFLNKLLSKIDISLKERKDEWEIFENNFSQIHDDFFENLQHKHPELKKRDLKLCAYIKMNLSTKEIAPLMNLSIRGIETHKYRLKKKLDLPNEENLTDYLKNISSS